MNKTKIANNIFRFYPLGLLALFIVQVIVVVSNLGGNFPVPYIKNIDKTILNVFVYPFYPLVFMGFALFIIYPTSKIIDMVKGYHDRKQSLVDILVFMACVITFVTFAVVLNNTTQYIDWMVN